MYVIAVQYSYTGHVSRSFWVKYCEADSYAKAEKYAAIAKNTYEDVRIVPQSEFLKERTKRLAERKAEAQKKRQEQAATWQYNTIRANNP